jgi:ribosomal protein S18 acetylase RimI-like enzyme
LYRLRDFSETDAQTLAEIGNEAFRDEIARRLPPFTQEKFIKFHQREGVKLTVTEDNGMVAGFLVVTVGDEAVPAQVHLVGIKKSLRGLGLEKELVKFAIQYATDCGKGKLRLFTRPWNTAMRNVCTDTGFIPEAYLRKEYLGEDLIQYSLFLE